MRWPVRCGVAALLMAATPPAVVCAQAAGSDSVTTRVVAPGVVYRRIERPAGPWTIDVVEVDLRRDDIAVESVRALDSLLGRETTSSMARRRSESGRRVVAAVNADFFNVRTGESINNQIENGRVVRALSGPTPPALHVRAQLAMTRSGKPLMERFLFDGEWLTRWGPVGLSAVNVLPHANALVLFNRYYGDFTPRDARRDDVAELALVQVARHGDTVVYGARGSVRPGGGAEIPPGGAVLSGYGASRGAVRAVAASARPVRIVLQMRPGREALRTLVGGRPRIVADGRSVVPQLADAPGFVAARHPRTAVGFSRDSSTLYLLTVDGRQKSSVGMTLAELADQMLALGAYQALNLDGGGSTTMVVDGRVVSSPSDRTGERSVANALVIVR